MNRCQKTVSCLNCSDRESQNCLEFLNSTTIKRQSFPFNSSPSTFFFCKWQKNTNLGGLFASWTESLHFVQTLKIDKTSQDLHRDNHNKSLKDNKYSHTTTKFPLHPRQGHPALGCGWRIGRGGGGLAVGGPSQNCFSIMDPAQHPRGALGAPGVVYECLNDAHPVIDAFFLASNADNHVRVAVFDCVWSTPERYLFFGFTRYYTIFWILIRLSHDITRYFPFGKICA